MKNQDKPIKVVIEFTGDQIPQLGILCDVALKAAGIKVLNIASHIQSEVVNQVKQTPAPEMNGATSKA